MWLKGRLVHPHSSGQALRSVGMNYIDAVRPLMLSCFRPMGQVHFKQVSHSTMLIYQKSKRTYLIKTFARVVRLAKGNFFNLWFGHFPWNGQAYRIRPWAYRIGPYTFVPRRSCCVCWPQILDGK
jgi:hypothetical protein